MTPITLQQIRRVIKEELNEGSKQTKIYDCAKIEKVLYSMNMLKIGIEEDEYDIADLKVEKEVKETTHKILKNNNWDADIDDDIRHKQKIRRIERKILRDKQMIARIERRLERLKQEEASESKIKNRDDYYQIIPMIYFDRMTAEEVADRLGCSAMTISRYKKRLVEKLVILLNGADALE